MPSLPILTYGEGANRVTLQLGHLGPVRIRACYGPDGTQYLYHHLDISCDFLVNPEATQPPGGNFPGRGDPRLVEHGWMPSEAIPRLHRLLLLPRQKLIISRGDRVLLESPQRDRNPAVRYTCDANNGPNPIDCTFTDFIGDRTVRGTYRIETWIRFEPLNRALRTPTVIGHEWDVSASINEDWLTTRTISGRITLRRDLLLARRHNNQPLRAQDLWPTLGAHAVPSGYQRVHVDVRYTSDGTGISYSIVDAQRPWGVRDSRGILRIHGSIRRRWDWLSLASPSLGLDINLEAVGTPTATSAQLVTALVSVYTTMRTGEGRRVAFQPMGGKNIKMAILQAADMQVFFPERRAMLHTSVRAGGAFGWLGVGVNVLRGNGAQSPQLDNTELYPADFGALGGPTTTVNPALGWSNTTADPLLALVTQQLVGGYEAPPLPGTPRQPFNLTP